MFNLDVFKKFYKDGEFFCFAGQSTQAVTGMYNLNRASQIQFPGESILQEARDFTYIYLREKQSANQLLDKWIIAKDLPGEVRVYIYIYIYICIHQQFDPSSINYRSLMDIGGVWLGVPMVRQLATCGDQDFLGSIRRR